MMNELLKESVFFGVFITIGAYQLGRLIQNKWKMSISCQPDLYGL